jgi:glyoxylase-like metal-dependent hydrolase (beta-lactamase superfamily II)
MRRFHQAFAHRVPSPSAGCVLVLLLALGGVAPPAALAQLEDVEIEVQHLRSSIYMLKGAGGNVAACSGPDGVILVDDQYAPLTQKIRAAIRSFSELPIRFVLNTHWHADHTGGNENLASGGSLVVAHENVRRRMSAEHFNDIFDRSTPASPAAALPVLTFNDALSFHLNDEEIHALHVPHAHTDGDALVHFRKANVIHMGDVYWNGFYPFIDITSGGNIDGVVAACELALGLANEDTIFVPGHGAASSAQGLVAYRDMLIEVRQRVAALVEQGKDWEGVRAARPTAEFDGAWGDGFMKPEVFLQIVTRDLGAGTP